MKDIFIKDIIVYTTNLTGKNLVVVKVLTSEEGLYGVGCATFAYRCKAVANVIEAYLRPLVLGRNIDDIEDLWHLMQYNAYWRNGPIIGNAISGIDMALWDIKGKRAGLPLYCLFGGKVRKGVPIYRHADGKTLEEVGKNIKKLIEQKVDHIRIQWGVYGGQSENLNLPKGALEGDYFSPTQYVNDTLTLFKYVRENFGYDIKLIHDSHERLSPIEAIAFAKKLEQYHPFFLEDVLSPENGEWLKQLRAQTTTPIAMGELFNNPKEWDYLITNRLIDFVRVHISQIGGITPARKLAIFAEQFGIKTAWHGPSDVSPIGHAANIHLGLSSHNLGVQEWAELMDSPILKEAFPGMPTIENGYLYISDKPGLGIDINEELIKKYPAKDDVVEWTQTRYPDGTMCTP